ncbi:MAG: PDGLE domain-containing protein [Actinomycetota bacterium]
MDRKNLALFVAGGVLVALGLAFFVSPRASGSPDGLEKVAIDEGFDDTAEEHDRGEGPLADYAVEGVEDESLSTGLSGIIGVAITFGVGLLLFGTLRAIRGRRGDLPPPSRAPTV